MPMSNARYGRGEPITIIQTEDATRKCPFLFLANGNFFSTLSDRPSIDSPLRIHSNDPLSGEPVWLPLSLGCSFFAFVETRIRRGGCHEIDAFGSGSVAGIRRTSHR
jgi:hypothetical protein